MKGKLKIMDLGGRYSAIRCIPIDFCCHCFPVDVENMYNNQTKTLPGKKVTIGL